MAFQRSYSKVWWGSDQQITMNNITLGSNRNHSYFDGAQQLEGYQILNNGYNSLDLNNFRGYGGNLSRIQEVDDEHNISRLSRVSASECDKHDSPGSLRSQDSGFSDNETHFARNMNCQSSKTMSPSIRSIHSTEITESPISTKYDVTATPPTVIRRVRKPEFYSPLVSVSRRISFTGPSTNKLDDTINNESNCSKIHNDDSSIMLTQLDETHYSINNCSGSSSSSLKNNNGDSKIFKITKRRRRVVRQPSKPLAPTKRRTIIEPELNDGKDYFESQSHNSDHSPTYNNETVYLGIDYLSSPQQSYNNETILLGDPINYDTCCMAQTSTPKRFCDVSNMNPLLQEHPAPVHTWLNNLRISYDHEVMSTLQTKSIAQQAIQNLTITTNTVTKLIRQLQQHAICLQSEFERIERLLFADDASTVLEDKLFQLASMSTDKLLDHINEFTLVLKRRAVFFANSRIERKRYDDCLEEICIIVKDTRYSLERKHYISPKSLLDDVQVIKRHLLFALRQIFVRMVHVIVQRIEIGNCDLMLRANINMIATLSNIDYEGFASLTDAFVQCETVRVLLIVCLEHNNSAVRAQALRALATICCAPESITQFSVCGGIEIIRDILQVPTPKTLQVNSMKHCTGFESSTMERREAVSLLTQITAVWHGIEHRVDGLRDCIETIVEGLTQMVIQTQCSQSLLLCAAALNNLSRIEVISHYSIMSNETIFRLIEITEQKEDEVTIFYYEQVVAMLHNMSLNKKCHSHLAHGNIINFITSSYQAHFYKLYESRAQSESQRRTVKTILHTLMRLVHDSNLGVDLLAQQQGVPAFLRKTNNDNNEIPADDLSQLHAEISLLARDLLYTQHIDNQSLHEDSISEEAVDTNEKFKDNCKPYEYSLKLNLARQESHV